MSNFIKRNGYVIFFLGFIGSVSWGLIRLWQMLPIEKVPVEALLK